MENGELLDAIVGGDVQAVDQALQSGASPDSEVLEEEDDNDAWRRHRSLLYLAAQVHSLDFVCVALSCLLLFCHSTINTTWLFCWLTAVLMLTKAVAMATRRSLLQQR